MTGTRPLVSFLTPTRKRLDHLIASIRSLESTAADPASFEVLLAFDEDDRDTLEAFKRHTFTATVRHWVMPRYGYDGLHHYVNALAGHASGQWLWLWNDECVMCSAAWDQILSRYSGRMVVVYPHNRSEDYQVMFPIVPRRWFERLGVFARWNHNDTYVWRLIEPLFSYAMEPGIQHTHPFPRLKDEVTAEIRYNDDCPYELIDRDRKEVWREIVASGGATPAVRWRRLRRRLGQIKRRLLS